MRTDDSDETLRQIYRDEGWGVLAEEMGFDPLMVEAQARSVFREWAKQRKAELSPYPSQDKAVDAFGDALYDAVQKMPENEAFQKARREFLGSLQDEIEHHIIGGMAEYIEGYISGAASRVVKALMEGDEREIRKALQLDGYNGRLNGPYPNNTGHNVIHGRLHDHQLFELRRKIAETNEALLRDERIKDLQDQVKSLVEQINSKDRRIESLLEDARNRSLF